MVAAFVEMYRLDHAPTPGKYIISFLLLFLSLHWVVLCFEGNLIVTFLFWWWSDVFSPSFSGGYDDVSARDNITPCQNIDDFNPYNYQDWAKVIDWHSICVCVVIFLSQSETYSVPMVVCITQFSPCSPSSQCYLNHFPPFLLFYLCRVVTRTSLCTATRSATLRCPTPTGCPPWSSPASAATTSPRWATSPSCGRWVNIWFDVIVVNFGCVVIVLSICLYWCAHPVQDHPILSFLCTLSMLHPLS